jgi:hypothetical protein
MGIATYIPPANRKPATLPAAACIRCAAEVPLLKASANKGLCDGCAGK